MLFRHFVNVGTTCFSTLPGSILAKFTVDLDRYWTLGFKCFSSRWPTEPSRPSVTKFGYFSKQWDPKSRICPHQSIGPLERARLQLVLAGWSHRYLTELNQSIRSSRKVVAQRSPLKHTCSYESIRWSTLPPTNMSECYKNRSHC